MTNRPEVAIQIELPQHERGVSPADLRRFDRAAADLANPRSTLKEEQRHARRRTMESIEAAPRAEAEARAHQERLDEIERLAKGRGEQAERSKTGGLRIIDRDPIIALARRKQLTAEQMDAAFECRVYYEARTSDVGAVEIGDSGRSAHDNDRFVHTRLTHAKALHRIATIERAITLECRDEPASLQMLRNVVGESMALSAFGEGRAYYRHLMALQRALDVAHGIIRGKP